jgi:hypothetical protein
MGICNNPDLESPSLARLIGWWKDAYAFNGSEASEFALEVLFSSIVAQPCNDECLKCIASDIWVIFRVVCYISC